ncbi:hypothetical protein RUM43_014714 [Polyplax serrata]|uniref:Uncharacterized protein n=1 Tax=Polyplax serrata TaxID=468196 RepID=A0AAN8NVA2_POLSC
MRWTDVRFVTIGCGGAATIRVPSKSQENVRKSRKVQVLADLVGNHGKTTFEFESFTKITPRNYGRVEDENGGQVELSGPDGDVWPNRFLPENLADE